MEQIALPAEPLFSKQFNPPKKFDGVTDDQDNYAAFQKLNNIDSKYLWRLKQISSLFIFIFSVFFSIFTYKFLNESYFSNSNLKQIPFEGLLLLFICIVSLSLSIRLLISLFKK